MPIFKMTVSNTPSAKCLSDKWFSAKRHGALFLDHLITSMYPCLNTFFVLIEEGILCNSDISLECTALKR
jgi:hypothetical protein